MKYICCPDVLTRDAIGVEDTVVFMAGGITGCSNWQQEVVEMLSDAPDEVVLVNPRRVVWDDNIQAVEQIKWEHYHLRQSDYVYFWFPREGNCMITLFELGRAIGAGHHIRVGVEPGYIRELDVREQLRLDRPNSPIFQTLEGLYSPLLKL